MIRVNSLFQIDVEEHGAEWLYEIFDNDGDLLWGEHGGSAWTSSEESMIQMGEHLVYKWCDSMNLVMHYGLAIAYRGKVEVAWWYEKPARDTTEQFHQALNKPEMWMTQGFEFTAPKAETRQVILQTLALQAYNSINLDRPVVKEFYDIPY